MGAGALGVEGTKREKHGLAREKTREKRDCGTFYLFTHVGNGLWMRVCGGLGGTWVKKKQKKIDTELSFGGLALFWIFPRPPRPRLECCSVYFLLLFYFFTHVPLQPASTSHLQISKKEKRGFLSSQQTCIRLYTLCQFSEITWVKKKKFMKICCCHKVLLKK